MVDAMPEVYGVDFSGARDAGEFIWISHVSLVSGVPVLESCVRGAQLLGSACSRALCLSALSRFVGSQGSDTVIGLDFPFSLPSAILRETPWDEFVRSFPAEFADCEEFRARCRQLANGRELRRLTDVETGTPFSAYNLRLYKQTYFGIRDVIRPLLQSGSAWFAPMGKRVVGKPCVIEICPASTLKRHGLYGAAYKGSSHAAFEARRALLGACMEHSGIRIEAPWLHDVIVHESGGNALDSIIAAWAACQALDRPRDLEACRAEYAVEGRVYV